MFASFPTSSRLVLTLAIIAVALFVRWAGTRYVRRQGRILTANDHRAASSLHHGSIVVIALAVLVLWLPQLQHFVLSITAIAVAIVIATKELTLCLLGTVVIRSSSAFAIGDWIEVNGRFGEVVERNLMSTTLQEIDPDRYHHTGRTATLPNSLFLTHTVRNQNFLRRYQFHRIRIVTESGRPPFAIEHALLERIRQLSEPFAETGRRYNQALEARTGIDIPDADPSIGVSTNETGHFVTTITVFCPTETVGNLQNDVVRAFFELLPPAPLATG